MQTLIIEDELPAGRQLQKLLMEMRPGIRVLSILDSVEGAVKWLRREKNPDLIFMDIQLADGLSFDIFSQVEISVPVIFTTAYDQYTLRAFKVNSIDYLLKPVEPVELEKALTKFDRLFGRRAYYDQALIDQLIQSVSQNDYKERFLVKAGQYLTYIQVEDIRSLYSEDGMVFALTGNGKKHPLDYTLEQLEKLLNPAVFFRTNRKVILHIEGIRKISPYFNSRLILDTNPPTGFDIIVSRDRVQDFKNWLDR